MTTPTLYRTRRETCAAIWRAMPRDRFDIAVWQCGSVCCALGELARLGHDGWRFRNHIPFRDSEPGMRAAASYFDLDIDDAFNLFSSRAGKYRKRPSQITPDDVAAALLAAPYVEG